MKSTKPTAARMMGRAICLDGFLVLVYWGVTRWVGHEPSQPEIALVVALLLTHWVMWFCAVSINMAWQDHQDQQDKVKNEDRAVDPWELQRALMRASDQSLPKTPTLNAGSLLYVALMLEEMAETVAGVQKVVERVGPSLGLTEEMSAVLVLQLLLRDQASNMNHASLRMRELLTNIRFDTAMTSAEAIEILDGTTDVAVTNAGFALACGLPGAAGYSEVVCSNLSKVNPVTGIIDKYPDGKWIKGRAYFKPDLGKVLVLARHPEV